MQVRIFQIGGTMPESYIGTATDPVTLKSLIRLASVQGATGVSLHGTMPHLRESVSGEFTLREANEECRQACDTSSGRCVAG